MLDADGGRNRTRVPSRLSRRGRKRAGAPRVPRAVPPPCP